MSQTVTIVSILLGYSLIGFVFAVVFRRYTDSYVHAFVVLVMWPFAATLWTLGAIVRGVETSVDRIANLLRANVELPDRTLSECFGVAVERDERFCPKCGWEARVVKEQP